MVVEAVVVVVVVIVVLVVVVVVVAAVVVVVVVSFSLSLLSLVGEEQSGSRGGRDDTLVLLYIMAINEI